MNRPLPTTNNNHDHTQQSTFKVNIILVHRRSKYYFIFLLGNVTWR